MSVCGDRAQQIGDEIIGATHSGSTEMVKPRKKTAKAREPRGRFRRKRPLAATATDSRPFGPLFFITFLRGFVRERCPNPSEGLPVVEIHLFDGEALDVCHIMGVAQLWVALAIHEKEPSTRSPSMRTEVIPYETISRVTIRSARRGDPHVGFDEARQPEIIRGAASRMTMTPEQAVSAAGGQRANTPAIAHRRSPQPEE